MLIDPTFDVGFMSFQLHFNFVASSTPCADLTLRLDIKNTGLLSKIRCKINMKVTLVFLQRQKFFQKIVFFPFSGLIKEPFDDYIYPLGLYPVLRGYHLSRLTRRSTVCPCKKVVIHHSLVPHLNPMPCLRHPKIVRIPYQPRYII